MTVRIIDIDEKRYKLLSSTSDESYSELLKSLYFMKNNNIPIEVSTEDVADTDGEGYYIDSISFVAPQIGGEIEPYIAVYVS